ncbi:MAG: YfbM family protein [Polyangia bacterium]
MSIGLLSLADANIARVVKSPSLAWRLIAPESPGLAGVTQEKPAKTATRGKKTAGARQAKAKVVPALKLDANEGARCDLERSWHGIHYLLTGSAWEGEPPLDFLVDGGRQVGRIDPEHGPVRAFCADDARTIYESMSGMSPYELRKRFNARDMATKEIYPDIWTRSVLEEDSLRYLMDNLDKLRAFLRQTVEAQLGFLVFLV